MIAIGDSQSDGLNDFVISPMGNGSEPRIQCWPGKRHNRGANIVFCDGHVEHARQKKWLAQTEQARRRWNHDNEPHPEVWDAREPGLLSKYAE
jgi:prepilin-type processing-associated H-X9-DG protein